MKIKSNIQTLIPYRSKQVDVPIVLNANETRNYLFPTGYAVELDFQKYPNTNADELRQALALRYHLNLENFIIGNGSTELLELSVKTFTEPGDYAITFDPSFAMYDIYAQIHGVRLLKVPAEQDKRQDIDCMIALAKRYNPSLIFLCTPNNPTGYMNTKDEVLSLINATDALVIVDEAYMDFAFDRDSVASVVEEYPNLIVARTFSKAYGLAAIRLGYLIANKTIINTLLKVKLPYSVNGVSVQIGLKALAKEQAKQEFIQTMITERERLFKELTNLSFTVVPSKANFVFLSSPINIQDPLLERGILIRSFGSNTYRISIGTTDENNQLLTALKEVLYAN